MGFLKLFVTICLIAMATAKKPSQEPTSAFATASGTFATDLYSEMIKGQSGNVIMSPMSIQTALSLAMFGAAGNTKTEMKNSMHYNQITDDEIQKNYRDLTDSIRATNGLKIANKVYVAEGHSVNPTFNNLAAKSFSSEAQTLNFANSQPSADTINQWVEGQTNNKIKNLIAADSLDSDTRVVLVNAIYFKGFWEHQFDPARTDKGAQFWISEEKSVPVDMMRIKKHFKYGRLDSHDATVLEMNYKDSDISMMIILPNQKTGLAKLEAKMIELDFAKISSELYSQEVNLELPKFKIEFDLSLNEPLKRLGMNEMFSNSADFSQLLESGEPLKVSEVVHKAFIEVNEEGAEAAAATGILFAAASFRPELFFKADKSFHFVIKSPSETLFMGRFFG